MYLTNPNKVFSHYDHENKAAAIIDLAPIEPAVIDLEEHLDKRWYYIYTYFFNPILWDSEVRDKLTQDLINWITGEEVNVVIPSNGHFNEEDNIRISEYLLDLGFTRLNSQYLAFMGAS